MLPLELTEKKLWKLRGYFHVKDTTKNTAFHYRAQKHLRTVWFDSSHGIHEKTLQHKLECFLVTRAGIEPTLTA